jgi:aspartyl-tRNA(Asn)/glutamyl-tRNA(Gln) amidotransferase subunit C
MDKDNTPNTLSVDMGELRVTAELAHIAFSEDELSRSLPAFQEMLSFFSVMRTAEMGGTAENAAEFRNAPVRDARFMREDAEEERLAEPEDMIARAGERDGRFIVIPNVL